MVLSYFPRGAGQNEILCFNADGLMVFNWNLSMYSSVFFLSFFLLRARRQINKICICIFVKTLYLLFATTQKRQTHTKTYIQKYLKLLILEKYNFLWKYKGLEKLYIIIINIDITIFI